MFSIQINAPDGSSVSINTPSSRDKGIGEINPRSAATPLRLQGEVPHDIVPSEERPVRVTAPYRGPILPSTYAEQSIHDSLGVSSSAESRMPPMPPMPTVPSHFQSASTAGYHPCYQATGAMGAAQFQLARVQSAQLQAQAMLHGQRQALHAFYMYEVQRQQGLARHYHMMQSSFASRPVWAEARLHRDLERNANWQPEWHPQAEAEDGSRFSEASSGFGHEAVLDAGLSYQQPMRSKDGCIAENRPTGSAVEVGRTQAAPAISLDPQWSMPPETNTQSETHDSTSITVLRANEHTAATMIPAGMKEGGLIDRDADVALSTSRIVQAEQLPAQAGLEPKQAVSTIEKDRTSPWEKDSSVGEGAGDTADDIGSVVRRSSSAMGNEKRRGACGPKREIETVESADDSVDTAQVEGQGTKAREQALDDLVDASGMTAVELLEMLKGKIEPKAAMSAQVADEGRE